MELVSGNVKAAMQQAGAKSSDLWKVPVENIHVLEGFNVRTAGPDLEAHIDGLAASILENGFYADKPLAGYVAQEEAGDVIYVTDGHCRLAAVHQAIAQGAEIETLPVVVSPKGTSTDNLILRLITTNTGKPLEPYEIGVVCKRLIDNGWELKEVAKRIGKTQPYLNDLLGLMAAPRDVQKLVKERKVSASTAVREIKKHGAGAKEVLEQGVAKAQAEGKTRATAQHIEEKVDLRKAILSMNKEWPNLAFQEEGAGDCWRALVELAKG
jgi:hypothetical protein